MIINKEENKLERNGISGEKTFGMLMNAKTYSLMTSNLYKDREGSVVREICSNAWDGMKMRSIIHDEPMQPYTITLPTQIEPHLVIEDFGTGMPDEIAQERFSTIGLSSKEQSQDQIGAYGLGSKSPYAVTDTFTVENTYEGVTYYYLCFKNEEGLPVILRTGMEKNESRHDGVKVIIPVPYEKFNLYVNAVQRQLMAMEPKPIVTNGRGFAFKEPVKIGENEYGYVLTNANEFGLQHGRVYAKMGMVIYPVDTDKLNNIMFIQNNGAIILNFNIGDIEPVPSREDLSYNEFTKKNLNYKMDKFCSVYESYLKKEILESKSALEAFNKMNVAINTYSMKLTDPVVINGVVVNNDTFKSLFPKFEYEWELKKYAYIKPSYVNSDGNLVPEEFVPESIEVINKILDKFQIDVYTKEKKSTNRHKNGEGASDVMHFNVLDNILNDNFKVMLFDEANPKYVPSRLKSAIDGQITRYGRQLLVIRVSDLSEDDKIDFSEFIEKMELVHPGISDKFIKFSDVIKPERYKATAVAKVADDKTLIKGIKYFPAGKYHEIWVDKERLNNLMEKPEYPSVYIKVDRNIVSDHVMVSLSNIQSFARKEKINLFLLGKSGWKNEYILKDYGIIELKDYIAEKMSEVKVSEDMKLNSLAKRLVKEDECDSFSGYSPFFMLADEIDFIGSVHPAIIEHKNLIRLSKIDKEKEFGIIDNLNKCGLLHHFDDGRFEFVFQHTSNEELKKNWLGLLESFNETYPAVEHIKEVAKWDEHKKYYKSSLVFDYIRDYNRLMAYDKANEQKENNENF